MTLNKSFNYAPNGAGQPKRGFAAGCRLTRRYVSWKNRAMTERGTKLAIYVFAVGSALFVPLSAYMKIGVLTPTIYAGFTLIMVYFSANPKLLNSSHSERKEETQQGPAIPIALFLGAELMIIGVIEAGVKIAAT